MVKSVPLGFVFFLISISVSGCASIHTEQWSSFPQQSEASSIEHPIHNNLFVFFDGTANHPDSSTNIWRLYQIIKETNDPSTTALYIEGVGTRDKPLSGMALGRGMEERILMGYEFITLNYHPGDNIYIFGFSRGAHQARALAGFLAYSGLPKLTNTEKNNLLKLGNQILEITKEKNDKDYRMAWSRWAPHTAPFLENEIKEELDLEVQPAEIKLLGVWDTVPGSSLKKFGTCKELEDRKEGDRYKSDSYPPLRNIAHAVSIDEKRSKFEPILLCPPINTSYTTVHEVWFPGAHADVGGGYQDSNELSGISLNWMLGILANNYNFNKTVPTVSENSKGLAHWSIGDRPANVGSKCQDRPLPTEEDLHPSYYERKEAGPVPIRKNGEHKDLEYPINCPRK